MIEKTPKKVDDTTHLTGMAKKLNLKTGKQENLPVRVTSFSLTDTKRSTNDVNVWVNNVCVVVDTGNPPDCVDSSDPRLVQASTSVFATDRVSGEAVNNPKYFVGVTGDTGADGLVNKFPFNTQKKDYNYWDPTLGAAAPATYAGTDDIDGLKVYKFHMAIDNQTIEIADGIQGKYTLDKTMWIEPVTGAIVNQEQHDVRKLEDGTNALDMQIAFTKETVDGDVSDGKDNSEQIKLITETVPLVGFLVGPLLILIGLVVVFVGRSGRRGTVPPPEEETVPPTETPPTQTTV